jgi:hypothetical protein
MDDSFVIDTLPDNQILYNGRVWRDLFFNVEDDQFLFSKEFLPGSVTMRGRTYSGIRIMYDIYKDEILIPYKPVGILQLNKEMVDSFYVLYREKKYNFMRISGDSMDVLDGYYNILYKGRTSLYVRYVKKIEKFADGGKYDKFYQLIRIYLIKDGIVHQITGKKDLTGVFVDDKKAIRKFIKGNKLRISKENAESFVPVLGFIDSLKN